MRIGLIAPPWFPVPPTGYGGTESVVDLLARGFADAGHQVLLAAAADSRCPVPRVPGLERADAELLGWTRSELHHVIRAYRALDGVDLIHDHTLAGPLYLYRPRATPVVTTVHNLLTPDLAEIYRVAAQETAVVAISRNQAANAPAIDFARVIHHGLDISDVPVGDGRGGYVCFLGRMNPDKGPAEAIRIARAAGIPLKIATKMRERTELEYFANVIKPMLGPDVELCGEVTAAEKYALLGGAVALLNPIQWAEPFGLVMIESLAAGTPVVGTPRGAAPEIVDDGVTGYLSANLDTLAALLPRVARLDRRACRAAVEERFTAARMVRDHLRLYRDLLARGPAVHAAAAG